MACNHPIKSGPRFLVSRQDHQTYVFGETPFFLYSYISFRHVQALSSLHVIVRMFLLPSTSPKLRTLTAYAASAMGAKLSFAFTSVTYKAVNPQLSTFLINTCRSCFAPIKSTLGYSLYKGLWNYLLIPKDYTLTQCAHGGGVGYCPRVLPSFRSSSALQYIYSISSVQKCQ